MGSAAPYGLNPVPLPRPNDADSTGAKRARHLYVMCAESCDDLALMHDGSTFTVEDEGSFAHPRPDDRSFVVARKKSDELPRNKIEPQELPLFLEAMKTEVPEVLTSMRVLSPRRVRE